MASSPFALRPQLALDVGHFVIRPDGRPQATVSIKNVGNITIFDAEVSVRTAIFYVGGTSLIFTMMPPPDTGVTIGPTETETLTAIMDPAPTKDEMALVNADLKRIVTAGQITYTDPLERKHERYICAQYLRTSKGEYFGNFCGTPKQF
ncbi:hypothetical protein H9L12_01025 [Sphingomonas rhizophila]|uniref:Uncharacterized protein n=1 Tax=Sphingomonas rhizophila TaxID=2071607 RepID=A0A7G9SBN9_9SPHN|nr:hypothetical protein [Sphingomonas rhizophila]QNN65264.1 hypothetical protein H9L12_01025 [Sphingomonas rhizophila]